MAPGPQQVQRFVYTGSTPSIDDIETESAKDRLRFASVEANRIPANKRSVDRLHGLCAAINHDVPVGFGTLLATPGFLGCGSKGAAHVISGVSVDSFVRGHFCVFTLILVRFPRRSPYGTQRFVEE